MTNEVLDLMETMTGAWTDLRMRMAAAAAEGAKKRHQSA